MSRPINITGMNRPVKTLVYYEASTLEEHAGKEFNTGISKLLEE